MNSRPDEKSDDVKRKLSVEALPQSADHLRLVIDTIPAFVWSAGPDGNIEFLNQRGLEYTGLTMQQLRGWNWKDSNILHPDDFQGLFETWSAIVASGQPGEIQARMRRFDGEYRWFLFRVAPLRDESGRLVAWWGIDLDIHDRIRAEDKLRQSEAYLAEAQRLSHTGSFGWNVATGALVWSEETFCILGYDETIKPTLELVFKRIHPDDIAFVRETLDRATHNKADLDFEHRLLMPDGSIKHVRVLAQPAKTEAGALEFVGALMDITEAKRAEEKFCRSQAYLVEAQKLSRVGSFCIIAATGEIISSEETVRIGGWESGTRPTVAQAIERVHPDDRQRVQTSLEKALREETFLEYEHRLLLPDGSVRDVHTIANPMRNMSGEVEFVGAVMDITEKKKSEDALNSAKARFEGILEIAEDAIISVDSSQCIVLFNQGAQKVFGYAESEVIGKSLELLLPQRFAHAHRSHIEGFAKSTEISRLMAQRSAVFGRRKDGSEFPAEASISKLDLGKEFLFTVILRDITEQKRLENRLRRSESNLAEGQRLTKTGSWILDYHTGNTDWSVETCRIFGFPDPPPSPHYSEFRARVRPEDREAVDRGLRESFETGEPRPLEYIFVLPNGVRKNIETISQPVRDETGTVVKLMGTVMDVTERKQTAEALRASDILARGQLEALTSTLAVITQETKPEKFLEHVLRVICQQLGANGVSVWEIDRKIGCIHQVASFEENTLRLPTPDKMQLIPQEGLGASPHPVWSDFFRDGNFCVYCRIDANPLRVLVAKDPNGPWHDNFAVSAPNLPGINVCQRLSFLGVKGTLIIPMLVAGKVTGFFSTRFDRMRSFRQEEIELTRAMSHQAMLAIQLIRLSQLSRETAIEAERNRMARDIHDTLAQGFTGIIVQLEAAKGAEAHGNPAEVADRISRAGELARSSLEEARRSVRALRPRALRDGRLSMALQDLLKRMTEGTGLNADFKAEGDERRIPSEYEEGLLRITQESLTNTVKHANARIFNATLNVSEGNIRLQLVDDGRGFDPQAESDGFGLIGMKERVDQMGGQFIIRSNPGVGTEILVVLINKTTLKSENGNEQA
jgi:PAS domain S-box-containing protein